MIFLVDISNDDFDFNEEDLVWMVRKLKKVSKKAMLIKFNKGKLVFDNFINK